MKTVMLIYKGVKLEVIGVYTPAEPEVYNVGDGSGYPGMHATFEVDMVLLDGIKITELVETMVDDIANESLKIILNE